MTDLNAVYRSRPALWSQDTRPEGYSWIDANDSANNVLSFLRYGSDGSVLACVFNFAGTEHSRYRLGLPHAGPWREVLNSDATHYNGSGIGNNYWDLLPFGHKDSYATIRYYDTVVRMAALEREIERDLVQVPWAHAQVGGEHVRVCFLESIPKHESKRAGALWVVQAGDAENEDGYVIGLRYVGRRGGVVRGGARVPALERAAGAGDGQAAAGGLIDWLTKRRR